MDALQLGLPAIVVIVFVALAFDFINGLHDAANSIATVVSTRVLSPKLAVLWAAFFNFIAFLFFGLHVATTIGTGLVDPLVMDPAVILAALIGAIAGAGSARRTSAVRWGLAGRIVWAWVLTIPASGIVAWLSYLLVAAVLRP